MHHLHEGVVGQLLVRAVVGIGGRVAHHHVDRAELLPGLGDQPLDLGLVGDVAGNDRGMATGGADLGHHLLRRRIVNNAGYTWDNVVQKMTDEQWYAMLDVHLTAPFRILRAAQPVLRALNFLNHCQLKTLYLGHDELIVGERGPAPKVVPTFPELTCHSVEDFNVLNTREQFTQEFRLTLALCA